MSLLLALARPAAACVAIAAGALAGAAAQVADPRYDPEMRQVLASTTYGVVDSDIDFEGFGAPPELIALGRSACASSRLSFSFDGGTLAQTLETGRASDRAAVARLTRGSTIVATAYVIEYAPELNRPNWTFARYPGSGVLVSNRSTPTGGAAPSPPSYQAFVPCG
jgi:hypothetical protein